MDSLPLLCRSHFENNEPWGGAHAPLNEQRLRGLIDLCVGHFSGRCTFADDVVEVAVNAASKVKDKGILAQVDAINGVLATRAEYAEELASFPMEG